MQNLNSTDDEGSLERAKPVSLELPNWAWIVGFVMFPIGPFVCLRLARVISSLELILGIASALIVQIGISSVLGETNNSRLQVFIVFLLGAALFNLGFWQYCAGQKKGYWSTSAQRLWRTFAKGFGVLLACGLVLNVVAFHIWLRNSR